MYQLKIQDDKSKLYISDHEFNLLPEYKKRYYTEYKSKLIKDEKSITKR